MSSRSYAILVCLLMLVARVQASQTQDPRSTPITPQMLQQQIASVSINSEAHLILIARANVSHLAKEAYEQYNVLCGRHPKEASAYLWKGLAAENYHAAVSSPFLDKIDLQLANRLLRVTDVAFSKAVELKPDSALAEADYGFFLWQYYDQMSKGLTLLRTALSQSPKSARFHALLGEVYSNPSGNAYDAAKAKHELETAITLDSAYSYPHWVLVHLYLDTHQYKAAQAEMQAYLSLLPAGTAQKPGVRLLQEAINKGLSQ